MVLLKLLQICAPAQNIIIVHKTESTIITVWALYLPIADGEDIGDNNAFPILLSRGRVRCDPLRHDYKGGEKPVKLRSNEVL